MLYKKNNADELLLSDKYEVILLKDDEKEAVDVFKSLVSVASGEHKLPDELASVYDEIERGSMVNKSYFAIIESRYDIDICVKYNGSFKKIDVAGKVFDKTQDGIVFTVSPDEVVTVKLDSEFKNCLRIICNKPVSIPDDQENLIEFTPGYYTIENCEYITEGKRGFPVICNIPDNTTVYLHHGAIIDASIVLENKHNVKICGGGMINTISRCYGFDNGFAGENIYGPLKRYTYPAIYIKTNSSDIQIEGITMNCEFRGIVIRNGENINISKVKVLTSCINADGINMMNVRHIKIADSFVHSHDDGIAMFTSCDSITYLDDAECANPNPVTEDIEIYNTAVVTASRPFCIGGHATGNTNPHDRINNVYIHNMDLTNYRRYYGFHDIEHARKWSGIIRLLSQTEQIISNVRFEDIACHKKDDYEGQPIHIEVRGSNGASYTERGGYRIENISFKNISFREMKDIDLPIGIFCTADNMGNDYCIDKITFDNVTFGNAKMDNSAKYIEIKGKVFDIVVK